MGVRTKLPPNSTTHDHRSDPTKISVIYFGLLSDNREADLRIKIGYTGDFRKRESDHVAAAGRYDHVYTTLCVVRGKQTDESAIHRAFKEHRWGKEKEIFHPAPPVVDYVRWLRDQYYAFVPDDDQGVGVEFLETLDSSFWMPTPERRKAAPPRPPPELFPVEQKPIDALNLPPRELTGDDYYTNPRILAAARLVLGSIDLDPASHAIANREVQARTFYTVSDNGLTKPWGGNVWLNPPFSKWSSFVPKILSEWSTGNIRAMCVLSAMRTITTQYFAPLLATVDAWCVIRGRIPFWGGVAGGSPDDGHAVFYFGQERERFREVFSTLGTVYYKP